MALAAGRVARGLIRWSTSSCCSSALQIRLGRALSSSRQLVPAPLRAAAGDIADDIDWTEDMPVPIKRRVAALRQVQRDYDELMKEFVQERAELQAKYEKKAEPLVSKRAAVVAGAEAVGTYDIPDSDSPAEMKDEGIPDFWLTAITNHEMVGEYVREQDAEVLAFLSDVRVTNLTGDNAGSFKLEFTFTENPFFTNKTLEKTFYMEDPDEIVPDKFVGCSIDWLPGKNTTVTTVKKKVSDKKNKGKGAVTVTQQKACDSFFNFFKTPNIPENPDDLTEEELETLQQQMDEDYEIAIAFKESIVPRAVEWYTGEASPPMYGDELDEFDEEEVEEDYPPKRR